MCGAAGPPGQLRAVLGGDDGHELFGWLRTLTFIEEADEGLYPHDVARDALDSDLRWRDPAGYADLHRRLRAHLIDRARRAQGGERDRQRLLAISPCTTPAPRTWLRTWACAPCGTTRSAVARPGPASRSWRGGSSSTPTRTAVRDPDPPLAWAGDHHPRQLRLGPAGHAVRPRALRPAVRALRLPPRPRGGFEVALHRVVDRTFVHPAATQELAAELLVLPFSTYRRYRNRGVQRVTSWLWKRELSGPAEMDSS